MKRLFLKKHSVSLMILALALVLGFALAVTFASCDDGGGGGDGGGQTVIVPGGTLQEKLGWVANNGQRGNTYIIEVSADEIIVPHTFSYGGYTVILIGIGEVRTISGNGTLFDVEGNVVLDDNITLRGRSDNNGPIVVVSSNGTLVMNAGSLITGNTSNWRGGGVYVTGGSFTIAGGEISGNTATGGGGGVYVVSSSSFHIVSGTIYGSDAASNLRNTVSDYYEGTAALLGLATYGRTPNDNDRTGWLNSSDTTIRVVNGVLR